MQIIKAFLEGGWNYSILFSCIFSIFLVILGRRSSLRKVVNYAILTRQRKIIALSVFLLPIFLTIIIVLIQSSIEYDSWKNMNTEGGFIEYGTSLAYILAFIFAIPIGKSFLERKSNKLGILYYLIAAAFLFVGMEEMSWGQRLLGIESPDFFQTYNSQSEITIHNLVWIKDYFDPAFMFLGLVGGTSWLACLLIRNLQEKYWVRYLLPSPFLSSFFLIVFLFFFIVEYIKTGEPLINTFQEFIELIFSLGCLSFVITNFFRQSFDFDKHTVKSTQI
ncbi:MAG: hypothetical protein AB4038_00465 [Prochloraceae cyanobacterium]